MLAGIWMGIAFCVFSTELGLTQVACLHTVIYTWSNLHCVMCACMHANKARPQSSQLTVALCARAY